MRSYKYSGFKACLSLVLQHLSQGQAETHKLRKNLILQVEKPAAETCTAAAQATQKLQCFRLTRWLTD